MSSPHTSVSLKNLYLATKYTFLNTTRSMNKYQAVSWFRSIKSRLRATLENTANAAIFRNSRMTSSADATFKFSTWRCLSTDICYNLIYNINRFLKICSIKLKYSAKSHWLASDTQSRKVTCCSSSAFGRHSPPVSTPRRNPALSGVSPFTILSLQVQSCHLWRRDRRYGQVHHHW